MERLTLILKWLVDNHININSIHFDNITSSTLIMYNEGDEMIELTENNFYYYNKNLVKKFNQIRTEEIIKFLDNKL